MVATFLSLNLLIFLAQTIAGGSSNTFNLVRFGAQHGPSIENGQYWRFVTAAFLHIGLLHIFMNGICLWQLGTLLERLIGPIHFGFLYLASGVAGTTTSFFMNEFVSPQVVSAGASGAIFGVAGAMLVAGLRYSDQIPESLEKAFGTGALPFIAFNLYYGFARGGVDNYAHIGGALAGAALGAVLHPHHETLREGRRGAACLAGLVLVCFGFQYRAVARFERDLRAADELNHAGHVKEAQSLVERLRKQGMEDTRVLTLASILNLRQGKLKEALADLGDAEKIAPRYAPAKIVRGDLMMLLRNYGAAVALYQQAARLEPGNASAFSSLGGALLGANRVEEASAAFREAMRLDPKLAAAHYGLALTLVRQERFKEAAESFRQAIALEPRSLPARHGLVHALIADGQKDAAAVELRHILGIEPADEAARKALDEISPPAPPGMK
ncbi:MAG: rhomboid family intramembrane serine protease [Acidobacteria bacterium]|nr:rhomboid family intramembrane serine protease [Acidobacteriota bacterium]